MKKKLLIVLGLSITSVTLLAGCSNIGDTNPTSPEKMEEVRQKMNQERSNFKPPATTAGAATPGG